MDSYNLPQALSRIAGRQVAEFEAGQPLRPSGEGPGGLAARLVAVVPDLVSVNRRGIKPTN